MTLNSRPRKCLGFKTPYETFKKLTGVNEVSDYLVKDFHLPGKNRLEYAAYIFAATVLRPLSNSAGLRLLSYLATTNDLSAHKDFLIRLHPSFAAHAAPGPRLGENLRLSRALRPRLRSPWLIRS